MTPQRPPHIAYEPAILRLIDQTKLPDAVEVLSLDSPAAVVNAIREMRVRGAPAIGIAGGIRPGDRGARRGAKSR